MEEMDQKPVHITSVTTSKSVHFQEEVVEICKSKITVINYC